MHINNRHIKLLISPLSKIGVFFLVFSLLIGCESSGPKKAMPTQVDATKESIVPAFLSDADELLYQQAVDAINRNEFKKAEKSLVNLQKKYKSHLGSQVNLAIIYFKQEKYPESERAAKTALNIDENNAAIYNLLGLIAVENKDFKYAEKYYVKALTVDKNFADAHHNAALLYDVYFQDIPTAYKHYRAYLALTPNDNEIKNWVEQLKYSVGNE